MSDYGEYFEAMNNNQRYHFPDLPKGIRDPDMTYTVMVKYGTLGEPDYVEKERVIFLFTRARRTA